MRVLEGVLMYSTIRFTGCSGHSMMDKLTGRESVAAVESNQSASNFSFL